MSTKAVLIGNTVFLDVSCLCETPLEAMQSWASKNADPNDVVFVGSLIPRSDGDLVQYGNGLFVGSERMFTFHVILGWDYGD